MLPQVPKWEKHCMCSRHYQIVKSIKTIQILVKYLHFARFKSQSSNQSLNMIHDLVTLKLFWPYFRPLIECFKQHLMYIYTLCSSFSLTDFNVSKQHLMYMYMLCSSFSLTAISFTDRPTHVQFIHIKLEHVLNLQLKIKLVSILTRLTVFSFMNCFAMANM